MATAALLALLATLALGVVVGLVYLQRGRRKKTVVTAHLVAALAAAALVVLAVVTGAGRGGPHAGWPIGLVLFALAAGYGALRYMRGRTASELALVAHVFAGVASFLVFLAWMRAV